MCGIVAQYARTQPIAPETFERALDVLAHRGPDDARVWLSENRMIGLGHRRLSIIDLATGTQPLANEDGQIQIVVNGEFYDFEKIRRALETRGHSFQTASDSEIAVHLYEEFGLDFVQRLRGEFAFVLWDAARQRLVAGRDRFGIKPLFYAEHENTLVLASEVKALFAAGIPAGWDFEAVYRQLFLCYAPDHSMFRGVRQIPPGHLLLVTNEKHKLVKYWDFSFPCTHQWRGERAQTELVLQVRELLTEAVRLRLRADVPVGVMLSGGLDSTTVLGIASAHASKPPTAFSIGFDGELYDESAIAERAARFYGAEFHCIRVTEKEMVAQIQDAAWHGEMVQYNAHGIARFLLSRVIRNAGYKVVLGGEGADEIFAGYDFLQAPGAQPNDSPLTLLRALARLARRATPAQRTLAETSPWLARLSKFANVPPPLQLALAERMTFLRALLAPAFLSEFRRIDPYHAVFNQIQGIRQLPRREYARQVTYVWLKTFFANYHLGADRLDMAHSVEVRLPFLDHVLFEYVSALPMTALAAPGKEKLLLRDAAKPFIPEWIYQRPKKGFMAPPIDFHADGPLAQFIQNVLRGPALDTVPFFNARAIVQMLDALPAMSDAERAAADPVVMLLTSLTVLHERFHL